MSASIFHTKTEGCRRWACDRAPSVRQTKTMAGGTEKRHRTMVFERKFMISNGFLAKTQELCAAEGTLGSVFAHTDITHVV